VGCTSLFLTSTCSLSIYCNIVRSMGPFPAGVILHSYLGSGEMVPEFAKLGAYFSFSGFLMSLEAQKAKKMLKTVS
jgi:TatD DNase family protein